MKTKEISRSEWNAFFQRFSKCYQGWRATIEVVGPTIGAQITERELPFEGITADLELERIAVMAGSERDDHITHTIVQPTQVTLEQTDEGIDETLAIKSADGNLALLRLHAALLPEFVDSLAP